jgi:UDP-GlcNAc:undecaprenyl-phosphate GlcNAc-1-phosphate transferase
MRSYVGAFILSGLVAALFTPLARWFALRVGAVSVTGGRHVHERSVPRLGGIAIALAFIAPVVALLLIDGTVAATLHEFSRLAIGLMLGGAAVCILGVVDDIRGVPAIVKLAVQIGAACIAYACGFRIDAISLPFVGELSMGVFALPVTLLWVVGITNAVNLIDGLDGLAAGVVFFAATTNLVVGWISESPLIVVLMASMMGSLVGFLFYNFNPARIFMGDSGSNFLGFVLAATSLAGSSHKASTAVSLLVPVVAMGVPIFDTLLTIVRRWLERRPLFSPDRGHVHHRLLDMGITHRRAVLILYGVSVAFTAAAIAISLGRSWEVGAALLAATAVCFGFARSLGYFEYLHVRKRQKMRLYDRHTERLRRMLPKLFVDLRAARGETEVWTLLGKAMHQAEFGYFEVLRAGEPAQCAHHWSSPDTSSQEQRGFVSAKFPVGRDDNARALLKFGWRADTEDVSPQNDILLQILVDAIETRLTAFDSPLAPQRGLDSSESSIDTQRMLTPRVS